MNRAIRAAHVIVAVTMLAGGLSAGSATAVVPDERTAGKNPRCVDKAEVKKLDTTRKPWKSGTTLAQARRIIGSLGTAAVPVDHDYDPMLDGYDDHAGRDYRVAVFVFGVVPEYQFGWGPTTPACHPWDEESYVVLVFRQYERSRGGYGTWRLVGGQAPPPSPSDSGFRGSSFASFTRNPATDPGTPDPDGTVPQIGIGRWRDLHVGMSVRSAVVTGMVTRHAQGCDSRGLTSEWAEHGWVNFAPGNQMEQIAIWSPEERATQDTGVGSTLSELRDVYPDLSGVQYFSMEGHEQPYVSIQENHRTLAFQFATDTRPGAEATVKTVVLSRYASPTFWVAC